MRMAGSLLVSLAVLGAACSRPPVRRPVAMEPLPPPEEPRSAVTVEAGGFLSLVAEGVAFCDADNGEIVRAYGDEHTFTLLGRIPGRTTLHVRQRDGALHHLDVEVTNDPSAVRALGVSETITIPWPNLAEVSESGNVADVAPSADGSQLIVTGLRAGQHTVVLVLTDGSTETLELVVVNGSRRC